MVDLLGHERAPNGHARYRREQWVKYLLANLRDAIRPRFEPGHRHTAFVAASQPSDGMPNATLDVHMETQGRPHIVCK